MTRQEQYDQIVQLMKQRFGLRIKRWRKRMSGCAWRAWYADGSVVNWVEAPYPKSPMSLAVFLHEVGHHAIGFDTYKQRCEEEWAAWQWSLATMRDLGIEPTPRVHKRVDLSLRYAVAKAERRGIKQLPEQLTEYSRAA
ncbi:MAG: hypothetical protein AAF656_06090 [Planctomycetota bacterium]